MARTVRKLIILIVVFLVSIVVFSKITNPEVKDNNVEMAEATYPVGYFETNGQKINKVAAYAQKMNILTMRYTVTPVPSDNVLKMVIDNYDNKIESVSFEVRSLDTTRLIQEGDVHFNTGSNVVTADIKLERILEEGQEYSLSVIATSADEKEFYFYTRIIKEEDAHISECIDFANEFHEMTMDKELASGLKNYMETNSSVDNVSLQTVTINNKISQASWGSLKVTEASPVIASIKELNESYNVIMLNYIVTSVNDYDENEYYNVEEYYRVRYGKEKMYLLDFERTVEQVFTPVSTTVSGSEFTLGIRSDSVDYKCNEAGNVVCFVQQGELWSYNTTSGVITKVFSFRSDDIDIRDNITEHDIRIIRAGESGNIDFIVYGYMNKGDHEGYVGISVCHYDCVDGNVEELAFIPTTSSFQLMKEEMGQQMYISDDNIFYVTMNNKTYAVNLSSKTVSTYKDNVSDYYVLSEDGRYIAWCSEGYKSFHICDFETNEDYEVSAEAGQVIKPLGFIGDDCIYGSIGESFFSDVTYGIEGVPLSHVYILDTETKSVIKEYYEQGKFVTNAYVDDSNMYLERVEKQGEGFVETSSTVIRNNELHGTSAVSVSTKYSDVKQKEIVLKLPKSASSKTEVIRSTMVDVENPTVIDLGEENLLHEYYVYAKGRLLLATNSITRAISVADDNKGVVVTQNQSYVWKRAKATKKNINMADRGGSTATVKAINIILNSVGIASDVDASAFSGKSAYDILCSAAGDRPVYDLTGCTLSQILYFVGEGTPVYSVSSTGQPIVISGYDSSTVSVYYPASDELEQVEIELAEEKLATAGNVFYVIGK